MAKFEITYKSGKVETVEQNDCTTVEQFVNCKFGRGVDVESYGVKVVLVGAEEVAVESAPAPKKTTSKKVKVADE